MKKVLIIPFHIDKQIEDADYLSEGIVEELIDYISELKPLVPLGRNLSLFLKKHPRPGKELAAEFGVAYIIEGSVKRRNEETFLTIRLIKATEETLIDTKKSVITLDEWTHPLHLLVANVFKSELSVDGMDEKSPKRNVRELYLKGLYHWNRYTHAEMNNAISYYKQAIKIDPQYAPAYAGLADCYTVIGVMGYDNPTPAYSTAFSYITQALRLNDKHSDSYLAAALLNLFYKTDFQKVKSNLDYAFGLNRNNPKVHHLLSFYYAFQRDFEQSEKHCLASIKLDPLCIPHYVMLIRLSQYQRNFSKALEIIEATLTIDHDALPIIEIKALTHLLNGNVESAISIYRACIQRSKENLLNYAYLSYAFSVSNFYEESQKIERELDEIAKDNSTGNYEYAKAIIMLGRKNYDGFFFYLEKTMDAGLTSMVGDVYNNPIFSELRKDSRYQHFIKTYNLGTSTNTFIKKRKPISLLQIETNTKERLTLDPQDIAFIKGDGNYCTIHWYKHQMLTHKVLRITLKHLENQLSDYPYLVRVHKSFIVNLDEELHLRGNTHTSFLESSYFPIRIPVSRSKSALLKQQVSLQK